MYKPSGENLIFRVNSYDDFQEFSCSECNLDLSDTEGMLDLLGFKINYDSIPVEFAGSNIQSRSILFAHDYSLYDFTIFDTLDKEGLIGLFLDNCDSAYISNPAIIITDDNIFCNQEELQILNNIFDSSEYSVWIHLNLFIDDNYLPSFQSSFSFAAVYSKSKSSDELTCGSTWHDDDDGETYKGNKVPYKADEFDQIVSNYDETLYKAYKNSANSSLGHLQKNAWQSKWDFGFQGAAGEAIMIEIYNSTIPISTGVVYFFRTKDFIGALNQAQAANALTRIVHSPDIYTDFLVLLGNPTASSFAIKCSNIRRKFLSYNDLHRKILVAPPLIEKIVSSTGSIVVEVKTAGSKNMFQSILRGIEQLNKNAFSIAGMPILALDEGNLIIMLNGLNDSQIDQITYSLDGLRMKKGGIDAVRGFNCQAINRLQALISEIKACPNLKPPYGYY